MWCGVVKPFTRNPGVHVAVDNASTCRLQMLDLSFNGIGDDAGVLLKEVLSNNAVLKELDVSHNNLGPDTGKKHNMSATCQRLCVFDVYPVPYCSAGAAVADGLAANDDLASLRIGFNSLGYAVTERLVQTLAVNNSLVELGLENTLAGSKSGDDGVQHLYGMVAVSCTQTQATHMCRGWSLHHGDCCLWVAWLGARYRKYQTCEPPMCESVSSTPSTPMRVGILRTPLPQ